MKVVIVHGSYGAPTGNWFPWLKKELEAQSCQVVAPHFPTPEGQNLQNWLDIFKKEAGELSSDTILIGHSIGPALILRLLEQAQSEVRASYLVSGWIGELGLSEFDPLTESFFEKPFDWKSIRKNCPIFKLYHGTDDPYVPLQKGMELAIELGATLKIVADGGHLNADSNYNSFDLLLADLCQQLPD